MAMVYITYFGAAMATINNSNTRIDFFIRKLPAEEGACPSRLVRAGMDGSGGELDVTQKQDGTWVHYQGRAFRALLKRKLMGTTSMIFT